MSLALLKHLAPSMGAYESSDQASNDDFNKRPAKKQAREARFKTHAERMTAMREAQKAQGRRKYRKRDKPIKIDNTNGAIMTVPRRKILKLRTPAVRELRRNVTPSTLSARKTLATTHTVEKKVREQKRRRDQRKQEKYERATQPAIFHETIGCFNCGVTDSNSPHKCPFGGCCLQNLTRRLETPMQEWKNNKAHVTVLAPHADHKQTRFEELKQHCKRCPETGKISWDYTIGNLPVCARAYYQWWGFPRGGQTWTMRRIIERDGNYDAKAISRKFGRCKKKQEGVQTFLTLYYNLMGQEFVDRPEHVAVKPFEKLSLFRDLYCNWCAIVGVPVASLSTFKHVSNSKELWDWVHIRKRPPVDTGCKTCEKIDKMLDEIKTPEDRLAYQKLNKAHNRDIRQWRGMYEMKKENARMNPALALSMVIDGMGQWGIWLPIFRKMKAKDGTRKMRQKITGIAAHSKYSGFYRNYPWISSGANLTCTILWLSLQWLNFELPPTIYLQVRLFCRSLLFIVQTMASDMF